MNNARRVVTASKAKNLSKFFEIDLVIKVFGFKIYELHYPPKEAQEEEADDE